MADSFVADVDVKDSFVADDQSSFEANKEVVKDSFVADEGNEEKKPGFLEGSLSKAKSIMANEKQQASQKIAQEQEAQAKAQAERDDPKNWSSSRFKKESPKPQTIEEQAVYDETLQRKEDAENELLPEDVRKEPSIEIEIPSRDIRDVPAAFGASVTTGSLGILESVLRTPESVARSLNGIGGMIGAPDAGGQFKAINDLVSKAKTGMTTETFNDFADTIQVTQAVLAEQQPAFKKNALLGQYGDYATGEAVKYALSYGDAGSLDPLLDVVTNPVAWASAIGNAVPSLLAMYMSGGHMGVMFWLEAMGSANDATEFERRTGVKITDSEFVKGVVQSGTINMFLEKLGFSKMMKPLKGTKLGSRFFKKVGTEAVKGLKKPSFYRGVLGAGFWEGTTEALQEINSNAASRSWEKDAKLLNGVLMSLMGGFGAGVGGGAAATTLATMSYKDQKAAAKKFVLKSVPSEELDKSMKAETEVTKKEKPHVVMPPDFSKMSEEDLKKRYGKKEAVKVKPKKPTPIKKEAVKVKAEPLELEAKKYKTAEEFVAGQQRVYHGSDAKIDKFDISKVTKWKKFGHFFTAKKEFAENFGENINEAVVEVNNPKIINTQEWNDIRQEHAKDANWFANWKKELKEQGFDGLKVESSKEMFAGQEVENPEILVAFEDSQIKTKSQLTDIWNKAQTTTESSLIEEAKKYKTAEEFKEAFSSDRDYFEILPSKSLKMPKKLYRGEAAMTGLGTGSGAEGFGLYTTTNKKIAKTYADLSDVGVVKEMPLDSAPTNPLYFRGPSEFQSWVQRVSKKMGMRVSEFNEKIGVNKLIESMGYDGVAFDHGSDVGIAFVKFPEQKTKAQLTEIWNKANKPKKGLTDTEGLEKQTNDVIADEVMQLKELAAASDKGGSLIKSQKGVGKIRTKLAPVLKHPLTGNKPINENQWKELAEHNLSKGKGINQEEYDVVLEAKALTKRKETKSLGKTPKTGSGAFASSLQGSIDQFENLPKKQEAGAFKLFDRVRDLAKKYTPRIGEKYTAGNLGIYYTGTKNVFVNALNNISTVVHEVVHSVDFKRGIHKSIMKIKGYSKLGNPIYSPETKKERRDLTSIYVRYYPRGKSDHKLEKRLTEGLAVFGQRMIEAPKQTVQEYPELYNMFITKSGKYYDPMFVNLIKDAKKIVADYQALDPLSKIGARVSSDANTPGTKNWLSWQDKFIQETLDAIRPIEVLSEKVRVKGTSRDPALFLRMYNNLASIVVRNINSKKGFWSYKAGEFKKLYKYNWKTLTDDLSKKNLQEQFDSFLVSRRINVGYEKVETLKKEIEKKKQELKEVLKEAKADPKIIKAANPQAVLAGIAKPLMQEINSIIKAKNEIKKVLDKDGIGQEVAKEAYDEWKETFVKETQQFDSLIRADLDLAYEVGWIKPSRYAEMRKEEGYATFKRELTNDILGEESTFGRTGSSKASSLKQRTGSELTIIAPTLASIKNHAEMLRKGMKQIITNKILDLAPDIPDLFQQTKTTRVIDDRTGRISYPQEKDPNIMMKLSEGKRQAFLVDQQVKGILEELIGFQNIHIFERLLVSANRLFTGGTTGAYIPFALTNFVVDQFTATAQSLHDYTPVFDPIKEIMTALIKKDSVDAKYFEEYLALGGERHTLVGWMDLTPNEFFEKISAEKKGLYKALDLMDSGVEILRLPSQTSEILSRAVEFIRARKAGVFQLEALERAGQITAPFHHVGRLGGGSIGRTFIKSVPYLNSALQVLGQWSERTFINKKTKARAKVVWAAVATAIVAGYLSIENFGDDEEKKNLDALSAEERSMYLYFLNPINNGKLFRLRVPDQMSFLANMFNMALGEAFYERKFNKSDYVDAATAWVPDQLNILDPMRMFTALMPQLIRPMSEVVFNKKTFPRVRDMISLGKQKLEPRYQKYEGSSPLAKVLGNKFNVSPIQIDHLMEGYLGRNIRFINGAIYKDSRWNPFQREVYFTTGRQIAKYYEIKKKVEQTYSARKFRKLSMEERRFVKSRKGRIKKIDSLMERHHELLQKNPKSKNLSSIRDKILDHINEL